METLTETHIVEALTPSAALTGKKWRGLILAADRWGSSAFYPGAVLERDGSRVFKQGTQIYQNHLSEQQERDLNGLPRPVQDLVGSIASDAVYGDEGEGPGLYADIEFHDSFVSRVTEAHKDIGLSVNANGLTEDTEKEGRFGPVLQAILSVDSVDVVTRAGAGGKLIKIIESDRGPAGRELGKVQSVTDVTKEDFENLSTQLLEAVRGIPAALKEALTPEPAGDPVETDEEKAEREAAEKAAAEKAAAEPKDEPVEVDHAKIIEALAAEQLPIDAVVLTPVINAVKAGTPLVEAVKAQSDLRDKLVGTSGDAGVITLREADTTTGLAYAVRVLG